MRDEWTEWLNALEANGATAEERVDAFTQVEALDQYDEGGVIVRMSTHERTSACGRVETLGFTEAVDALRNLVKGLRLETKT